MWNWDGERVLLFRYFWTSSGSRMGGSYEIGSVHPSVLPSVLLSRHFHGIVSLVFYEIRGGARIPCEIVHDSQIFQENFFPKKLGKWTQNGLKTGFFQFIWNFGHQFLLNLIYDLCSCTNPMFGKIFLPEIWVKMFSANQIAGFFNHSYLQNKSMK